MEAVAPSTVLSTAAVTTTSTTSASPLTVFSTAGNMPIVASSTNGTGGDDTAEGGVIRAPRVRARRELPQFSDELTMQEVAALVVPALDKLFPVATAATADRPEIRIISEPGRYFVEGASELYLQLFESAELPAGQQQFPPPKPITDDASSPIHPIEREVNGGKDEELITLWFVNEGTLGCFKDIVLSDVKFEPELAVGYCPAGEGNM